MRWENLLPAAVCFDLSDWTQIDVTGKDRQLFLHNFCTNEIRGLTPGEGCEAFVPNIKGRILGHVLIAVTAESVRLISVPAAGDVLTPHLTKYLLGVAAQVVDRSSELGLLALCGDGLKPFLASEFGVDELPPPHRWRTIEADGKPFLIGGSDMTSLPAVLLSAERESLADWRERIPVEALAIGTRNLFEILRMEAGFPWYGIDLTEAHLAQEAGRTDRAISFTKGCYLGQEPIARLDAMGHTNKELRGLWIDSENAPVGSPVIVDETEIGRISSSAASPATGGSIALAMIRTSHAAPGTRVSVMTDHGPLSAVIYWPRRER